MGREGGGLRGGSTREPRHVRCAGVGRMPVWGHARSFCGCLPSTRQHTVIRSQVLPVTHKSDNQPHVARHTGSQHLQLAGGAAGDAGRGSGRAGRAPACGLRGGADGAVQRHGRVPGREFAIGGWTRLGWGCVQACNCHAGCVGKSPGQVYCAGFGGSRACGGLGR